jgi:hypothetical protein
MWVDFVQVTREPADRSQPHRVPVLPGPRQRRPRDRVLVDEYRKTVRATYLDFHGADSLRAPDAA